MKLTTLLHTFLFFLFSTGSIFAQDDFSKFDRDKQFSTVIVTQKMFEMMANVKVAPNNDEEKAYYNLIQKLNNLKVYNTKNSSGKSSLKDAVKNYSTKNALKEHYKKTDNDSQVIILIDKNATETKVTELLMYNEGISGSKESIVLLIQGNFSLSEIAALTKKMNLPIGDTMSKIQK